MRYAKTALAIFGTALIVAAPQRADAQTSCQAFEGQIGSLSSRASNAYNALLGAIARLNTMNEQAANKVSIYDAQIEQAGWNASYAESQARSFNCRPIHRNDIDDCIYLTVSVSRQVKNAYTALDKLRAAREQYIISAVNAAQRQESRVAVAQQQYDSFVAQGNSARAAWRNCIDGGGAGTKNYYDNGGYRGNRYNDPGNSYYNNNNDIDCATTPSYTVSLEVRALPTPIG